MQFVADLHLHSKYSRAVSRDMVLPTMAAWGKKKGIDLLTTADWTHPLWFREIRGQLEEAGEGVYRLRHAELGSASREIPKPFDSAQGKNSKLDKEPLFLLTVEVSSIYSQGGKLRRMHNLIFAPNFDTAEKINKELQRRGVNLLSDGRPIMGLSSRNLIELVLGIDKNALLIPCHAWTPWFSLYGSNSGFDSIEECFGDYAKYIYAVETGLSSDPLMNWQISELENRSLLSFSDAHSPAKMGREATVFEVSDESGVISYETIRQAITMNYEPKTHNNPRIAYTIEFYPEEGKYHYTGHRNCNIVQSPQDSAKNGTTCPVCKRKLTVGVEHRVQELAREKAIFDIQKLEKDKFGVSWIYDPKGIHPPYVSLVPLLEIIREALEVGEFSNKARELYEQLTQSIGTEYDILFRTDLSIIESKAGSRVAEGIKKVRQRDIVVVPGYDGVFGVVKIWSSDAKVVESKNEPKDASEQMGLF